MFTTEGKAFVTPAGSQHHSRHLQASAAHRRREQPPQDHAPAPPLLGGRHCTGQGWFGIEHGLLRVDRGLVLRGIADEVVTRAGLPRHVRRSDPVTLVVRKDVNTTILLHTDAGVR